MSVVIPSNDVINMMQSASSGSDIFIVAPYIKHKALKRFLDVLSDKENSLICITRWLPSDIASEACDIEIFDHIKNYGSGKLMMHPNLHAKYYRAGNRCMVGSANLTRRGLSWVFPNNLELLVELPRDFSGLSEWEASLLKSAIEVTEEIKDQISTKANQLKENNAVYSLQEEIKKEDSAHQWLPSCPAPDRLWDIYRNPDTATVISSTAESAQRDLAALFIPPKIIPTKERFKSYVASILRQTPIFCQINDLASNGITDDQACELISAKLGADPLYTADQSWSIVKDWLIYFFPETFMIESSQEVLIKGRKLLR